MRRSSATEGSINRPEQSASRKRVTVINRTAKLKLTFCLTAFSLACHGLPASAQDPTAMSGPIDITANEQEFAGEQVIARGNVRVKYKDSIILAPAATLTRDPASGQPQRAVFTGHPRLTQGTNAIDAETLVFEVQTQRVIAEGNAHSEVAGHTATGDSGGSGKPGDTSAPAADGKAGSPGEKIITDSDRQEYDKASDKFEATGHVRVKHGDIRVVSDKLQIVYGVNKKPETAIFTGNVTANQGPNSTSADTITYNLATRRLQASGHVKSKVIQKAEAVKRSGIVLSSNPRPQGVRSYGPDAALAAEVSAQDGPDEEIIITSDSQDYSQESGKLAAEGNVKVLYQDTTGSGPKVVLLRNAEGKADRVHFIGRSQVSQPGRRWIADRITVTVADRKVFAEGNTKALILKPPAPGTRPAAPITPYDGSKLAERKQNLSSSRIEAPQ